MRRRWVPVFAAGAAALLGTGCAQTAADRAHPVLRHESAGADTLNCAVLLFPLPVSGM
jgi:hypothetical protein